MIDSTMEHFATVCEEADAANRRVIAESSAPVCSCGGIYAQVQHAGGGLDDHTVDWLRCMKCGRGYVVEVRAPNHVDVSPWVTK